MLSRRYYWRKYGNNVKTITKAMVKKAKLSSRTLPITTVVVRPNPDIQISCIQLVSATLIKDKLKYLFLDIKKGGAEAPPFNLH